MGNPNLRYAGFWIRLWAVLIDAMVVVLLLAPILYLLYGPEYFDPDRTKKIFGFWDLILARILPVVAVITFWIKWQATIGKMAISARIVRASDGGKPSAGQMIGRFFAQILSGIPLCLGFLWIVFDERKQGWHDKLAGTVVVRRVKIPQDSPDLPGEASNEASGEAKDADF